VGEAPFDGTVQVTLRGEILAAGHDLFRPHGRRRQPDAFEAFSVGTLHPFGSLEVHEVLQRRLAEGQQAKLHSGWVAPRLVRQVGPAYVWGRPDGGKQVLDYCPVQHLLAGDIEDHPPPARDGRKLIIPKARTCCALEAECGIEVLTHQAVLKLSSLAEKVGQLLATFHNDGGLSRHGRKVSPATAVLNGEDMKRTGAGEHGCPLSPRQVRGAEKERAATVSVGTASPWSRRQESNSHSQLGRWELGHRNHAKHVCPLCAPAAHNHEHSAPNAPESM